MVDNQRMRVNKDWPRFCIRMTEERAAGEGCSDGSVHDARGAGFDWVPLRGRFPTDDRQALKQQAEVPSGGSRERRIPQNPQENLTG